MDKYIFKNLLFLLIYFLKIISSKKVHINNEQIFNPINSDLSKRKINLFDKTLNIIETMNETLKNNKINKLFNSDLSQNSLKLFSSSKSAKNSNTKFSINFPVKNLYIKDYNLYDISNIKKIKKGNYYIANFDNSKIIYNFEDLKKTDICNYDNKQIFLITTNNEENKTTTKCEYLAESIGKGNSWYLKNDEYDKKPLIEINLNKDNNNHSVSYILKCGNIKNDEINYEKSYFNKLINGQLETVLFIQTSYACPKIEYFILMEFIEYFHVLFFF